MVRTYLNFLKKNIDLSPLGVEPRKGASGYFCTPRGASILGWAGVDGIHYCFIRGFGDMVFAVSPMNAPGDYVRPLARSFDDFLRLLLACGDAAVLEQAHGWDQGQLEAFLKDNPPDESQRAVLDAIGQTGLLPMEEPLAYIQGLQASFDYSKVRFKADCPREAEERPKAPAWKVCFEGGFWGGRGRAGRELPIRREFEWAQKRWLVPAVYVCAKGLVADFCVQAPAAEIRAFMDKWNLSVETHHSDRFTQEQQLLLEAENPLRLEFTPEIAVNGKALQNDHGCSLCWNPCAPRDSMDVEADVITHYGLDPREGWTIHRVAARWKGTRRPNVAALRVTLKRNPAALPGPHFRLSAPGDVFSFRHPVTAMEHTLRVEEYEARELEGGRLGLSQLELPTHYRTLCYSVAPELPKGTLQIFDCAQSDSPRPRHGGLLKSAGNCAASIGIIGGADGPTAIFLSETGQKDFAVCCSALRFEPVEDVEWRMVFYKKETDDRTVELL